MFDGATTKEQLQQQTQYLAASAHDSINGFMRIVRCKGAGPNGTDSFPITWCNLQVCHKLKRDVTNLWGADIHSILPPDFETWHRPVMTEWFDNPQDLILDRVGTPEKPYNLIGSDGKKHPVAVFIKSKPAYEIGVMMGIRSAPNIEPGAGLEIVFLENIEVFRRFTAIVDLIRPHMQLMGLESTGNGHADVSRARGKARGDKQPASPTGCPAGRTPEKQPEPRDLEPVDPNHGEDRQPIDGSEKGDSGFETTYLDA